MMRMIPTIHSSFPRIGESPDEQRLRRAFASLEDGKITEAVFQKTQDQTVDDVIAIQEKAGIEIITDGLIRWYDPASHLARNLKGFEINGLLRFFDTNFYYRQPVASDDIAEGNGAFADEVSYAKSKSDRAVKGVLLGPLSLAAMSLNKSSLGFDDYCLKLGELIGREVARMAAKGASIIQIEEPVLARNPERFNLFKECFARLRETAGNARLLLAFYFGDASQIFNRLPEIQADMFGIDFTYSPSLLEEVVLDGFPKAVAFGVLDGRNTRMEREDEVARKLEAALHKVRGEDCHVTTSCGLEFLPSAYAIKKLELTARVARLVNG